MKKEKKNIQELSGSSFENKIHLVKFEWDKNDLKKNVAF